MFFTPDQDYFVNNTSLTIHSVASHVVSGSEWLLLGRKSKIIITGTWFGVRVRGSVAVFPAFVRIGSLHLAILGFHLRSNNTQRVLGSAGQGPRRTVLAWTYRCGIVKSQIAPASPSFFDRLLVQLVSQSRCIMPKPTACVACRQNKVDISRKECYQ